MAKNGKLDLTSFDSMKKGEQEALVSWPGCPTRVISTSA